jgi:hypothetical protein
MRLPFERSLMTASVLTQDAYDPVTFAAVLVREDTVVCIDADDEGELTGNVRVVPIGNVIHVDAEHGEMVPGDQIADSFYGGCQYAFLDFEAFPAARAD